MKKMFKSYGRLAVRYTAVLCLALLGFLGAKAQYRTFLDPGNQHTYTSVATLYTVDPLGTAINGPGYVIASTAIDRNTGMSRGEIIRTDSNGAVIWTKTYQAGGTGWVRFNHIEKCKYQGNIAYLIVGSTFSPNPGPTNLFVLLVDDNGSPIVTNSFFSPLKHLLGTKGIMLSNGTFAIVGVQSDNMSSSGSNEIVVIKLNASFAVTSINTYSTPTATLTDQDGVTSLTATIDPDRIGIVGTANRGGSATTPGVMVAVVNTSTGAVVWDYNFSSHPDSILHMDAGADIIFENEIWVLSNSSLQHNYCLTKLNYTTGALMQTTKFFSPHLDQYGYELKNANPLGGGGILAIGGWRDSLSLRSATPFISYYNTVTNTLTWHKEYPGYANKICLINENNWLQMLALGQFGYYYNSVMSYRANKNGWVIVGSDSTATARENIRFWPKIAYSGATGCGSIDPPMAIDSSVTRNQHLQWVPNTISTTIPSVSVFTKSYTLVNVCNLTAKKGETGAQALAEGPVSGIKVYPNPADHVLSLDYQFDASGKADRLLTVYDITGRKIYSENLTGTNGTKSLNTVEWPAGLYVVNIDENDHNISRSRIMITHQQ